MEKPSIHVKLIRIQKLSDTTLEFRFARTDGKTVEYTPGQFFRFRFEDEKGTFERSYSLCNHRADARTDSFDLVVSKVDKGRATRLLFSCTEGLEADVSGPFGKLVLPDVLPSRLIMVCTSVGIAPFMPVLDELYGEKRGQSESTEVLLLFGIRSPDECLYREYLEGIQDRYPSFRVEFCFSRLMPDHPQASDYSGYVLARFEAAQMNTDKDLVFLCGNPNMIDESFDWLKQKGFRSRQVVREKYVFAKDLKESAVKKISAADQRLLNEKIKKYQPR